MNLLIKHAIKCKKCGDIIESQSIGDTKKCSCGACTVSGGVIYPKIYAANFDDYDDLSERCDVDGCTVYVKSHIRKRYNFNCPISCVDDVIDYHEDEVWDNICIEDENGKEIYKSRGFDNAP